MENDYHNPYDHRPVGVKNSVTTSGASDSDQPNHYEAPSCLVRNPSGSLFIPSSGKKKRSLTTKHIYSWTSKGLKLG